MRDTLIFLLACSMLLSLFTVIEPIDICKAGDVITVGSGEGYDYNNIQNAINAANITFTIYPLAVAGISSAFRMKRRDIEEIEANKLFNEWIIIIAGLTIISIITVVLAAILS